MTPRYAVVGGSLCCQDGGKIRPVSYAEARQIVRDYNDAYLVAIENDRIAQANVVLSHMTDLALAYTHARQWDRAANVRTA